MKMIFIFLDGFGLGSDDPEINPLKKIPTPNLDMIFKRFGFIKTDCSLGVPGLPQSATGQTAIFTGTNAPEIVGRHISGQPTISLRKIINNNNLFKELQSLGLKVANANVYRDDYLKKMLDPSDKEVKPSVTSVMTMSAGINFKNVDDYINNEGIYHDITGEVLIENGYNVEPSTPERTADILCNISEKYDFTLFEHFMSDIIGHKADMDKAKKEIQLIDRFLGELFRKIDLSRFVVVITSDHGNIEDMSVRTHTMNKVPTVVAGAVPEGYKIRVNSLVDIMPMVVGMFKYSRKQGMQ